ncbi:MAG: hypothetical protein H0V51_06585 [Chloroflexi bacterium]|nr:hypothetical protein [Chloroflexota bacterium]
MVEAVVNPERRSARLSAELLTLEGDALRLWRDADERRQALEVLVGAWERGNSDALRSAVQRWDDAVVAGLQVLGLPRGPIADIVVESFGRTWLGRKAPNCLLLIDGDVLRSAVRSRQSPDEVFRTWVHESLHGRAPFVLSDVRRHYETRGYEEGLVEGLARVITRDRAGMDIVEGPYTHYVRAYEALASVVGIEVEDLWRTLWHHPAGVVRDAFVGAVDEEWNRAIGLRLSRSQEARLLAVADRMFDVAEQRATVGDVRLLHDRWRLAFR